MGNTKKSKVDSILSISLGVLFLLVMLFIFFGYLQGKANREFNRANDCANMNSNWTYTKDGVNKIIDFPNKINYKYGETIVLTNTIPNDFEDGFYIYVHTDYCSVDAYIDGQSVQVIGIDYTKDNHTYENPIVVIEVPDGSSGKQIDLHIVNNGSKLRIEVYDILYGVKNEIRFKLTSSVIPIICATVVMVSLAIMFVIYSFFIHDQYKEISEDYVYLAVFILLSAIWIFTDLTTQGAYFVGGESIYLAHILSYILFPIPFIMYINKQLEKRNRFLRFQTTTQMVFVVLIMLFFVLNIYKMAYVMIASHILIIMILTETFAILIHNFLRYKKNNSILILIAIGCMGLTGLMTLINFYFNVSYDNTFAFKYGLIIFTVLTSVHSIMRGFKSISDKKTLDATYMLNEEFNIIANKKNILVAKYYVQKNLIEYSFEGEEKSITPQDFIRHNSTNKYAHAIMDFFYSIKQGKPKGEVGFEGTLFNKKGYYVLDYELINNQDNETEYALLNFSDQTDAHMQEEVLKEATDNALSIVKRGGSYYRFNLEKNILEETENNLFEENIRKGAKLKDFSNYINNYVLSESDKAMVDMMFSYEKLYSIYGREASQNFELKLSIQESEIWVRFSIECYSSVDKKEVIAYILAENIETQKKYIVGSTTGIDRISELLNANSFKTEVKVLLEKLDSSKNHTLMLLQINNYEHIIDEFGNSITNLIVKDLATSLKSITRTTDVIGRVAIDTFALFVPYTPYNDASNIYLVERINDAVKKTYYDRLTVSCSIGVVIYPNDGLSFDKLLSNAQEALNEAVKNNEPYAYFDKNTTTVLEGGLGSFENRVKMLFNYTNTNNRDIKISDERYRSVILYTKNRELNEMVKLILKNDFYIIDASSIEEVKEATLQEVDLACIITSVQDDSEYKDVSDICSFRAKKTSISDIGIIGVGSDDKYDIDLYNIGVNDVICDKEIGEKLIRSIYKICAKRKNDERQAYQNAKAFIEKNLNS